MLNGSIVSFSSSSSLGSVAHTGSNESQTEEFQAILERRGAERAQQYAQTDPNLSKSKTNKDGVYSFNLSEQGKRIIECAKKHTDSIIIKVGSSAMTNPDGTVNKGNVGKIADKIKHYQEQGKRVSLVASGAVAVGRSEDEALGRVLKKDMTISQKMDAAGLGQITLSTEIHNIFKSRGLKTRQRLVQPDTLFGNTEKEKNLKGAQQQADSVKAVVIYNANDSADASQLLGGDNDGLAVGLAGILGINTVALISDVDGYYTGKPVSGDPSRARVPVITDQTIEGYRSGAGGSGSEAGTGGMESKLTSAAELAFPKDVVVVLTSSISPHLFSQDDKTPATWFVPGSILQATSQSESLRGYNIAA